jgi:hypothetical protein
VDDLAWHPSSPLLAYSAEHRMPDVDDVWLATFAPGSAVRLSGPAAPVPDDGSSLHGWKHAGTRVVTTLCDFGADLSQVRSLALGSDQPVGAAFPFDAGVAGVYLR